MRYTVSLQVSFSHALIKVSVGTDATIAWILYSVASVEQSVSLLLALANENAHVYM